MPTTQITVTAFQTAIAEACDAIAASDWTTARVKYTQALGIKIGLDTKAVSDAESRIDRETLDSFTKLEQAIKATEAVSATNRSSFTRGIPA